MNKPGLNFILNSNYINSAKKSVPIIQLIRNHPEITSKQELYDSICIHSNGNCKCGIISVGCIDIVALNLLNKAKQYGYSYEECLDYVMDLFIHKSFQANKEESVICKIIDDKINSIGAKCRTASEKEDFVYAIDIVVEYENKLICGIQIKPESYKYIPKDSDTVIINERKNKKFCEAYNLIRVPYLYVDKKGDILNTDLLDIVIKRIKDKVVIGY